MRSYIDEIDELLVGETPKQKFEFLQKIIRENSLLKGRLDFCNNQFKIVRDNTSTDPYMRGYVSSICKTLDKDL